MDEEIKSEFKKIESNKIFTKEFKRKKTIIWCIRTLIAIVLFYIFWEHSWVKWFLILYIPLNLFGLFVIHGGSSFLKRKANKIKKKSEL